MLKLNNCIHSMPFYFFCVNYQLYLHSKFIYLKNWHIIDKKKLDPIAKKLMSYSESVATYLLESDVKTRAPNWLFPCVINGFIVFSHLISFNVLIFSIVTQWNAYYLGTRIMAAVIIVINQYFCYYYMLLYCIIPSPYNICFSIF